MKKLREQKRRKSGLRKPLLGDGKNLREAWTKKRGGGTGRVWLELKHDKGEKGLKLELRRKQRSGSANHGGYSTGFVKHGVKTLSESNVGP